MADQIELRTDLILQTMDAIKSVRVLVEKLNDQEKEYLRSNSIEYRKLVDGIKSYYLKNDNQRKHQQQ